jgi:hypothetical protein
MWDVISTDTFDEWFKLLTDSERADVLATMKVLQQKGPMLPRPYADTVYGSSYSNMKELRISSGGKPIRAFFAFDPQRKGILLCAGDKTGDKRFYDRMIPLADREFTEHLKTLK